MIGSVIMEIEEPEMIAAMEFYLNKSVLTLSCRCASAMKRTLRESDNERMAASSSSFMELRRPLLALMGE